MASGDCPFGDRGCLFERWRRCHDHDRSRRYRHLDHGRQRRHRRHRQDRLSGVPPPTSTRGLESWTEDFIIYDLVYDSLVDLDLEGNFQPEVATDWSVSDDGLTWTLTIRDDITFHDGTPLTAEDVVYSLNTVSGHR